MEINDLTRPAFLHCHFMELNDRVYYLYYLRFKRVNLRVGLILRLLRDRNISPLPSSKISSYVRYPGDTVFPYIESIRSCIGSSIRDISSADDNLDSLIGLRWWYNIVLTNDSMFGRNCRVVRSK